MTTRSVPALAKPKPFKVPPVKEVFLNNGLRLLVVRRPGVPLVEMRLRIPFAAPTGKRRDQHVARASLLSDAMLLGTEQRDAGQLARDIQALGAQLSVAADLDRLALVGSVLATGLPGLLALVGEVLTQASYPKDQVLGERDRMLQELAIHRSNPGVIAREALLARMYGEHPYARELPEPDLVEEVRPRDLRALHTRRVLPQGSTLVLVGDVTPAKAASAAGALEGWSGDGSQPELGPAPDQAGRVPLLVHRPGAVQTTIRLGGGAPRRTDEDYAATVLANLVFGGYFSSRWVSNIREDKGYTYSPHSGIDHLVAGSRLVAGADVATDVTAPALVETLYELGRLATLPVPAQELDQARRYALGTLALGTASQAGLAGQLSQLAGAGLELGWLREHHAALQKVTAEQVHAAAARWLAPSVLTPVLVGDREVVEEQVAALVPLETR